MSGLFGGVYTIARASATITVCSAAPVFSVFYRNLIMYFASSFDPSYNSLTIIDSLIPAELFPDVFAILLNSENT